jgi:glucose-1-phosphate thymidylyltransferase
MSGSKAIILAGGLGTRLWPVATAVNKHLLPVYDKPMIYYPLCNLMLAGFTDFLLISTPDAVPAFTRLLRDGGQWGVKIAYAVQVRPGGIAECFDIAEEFIAGTNVALALGDNIFYGAGLSAVLEDEFNQLNGAVIFGYEVSDPSAFGVVELDASGKPLNIEEKPKVPRSNLAVPGLYLYGPDVIGITRGLHRSSRGELEITDVNRVYLRDGRLKVRLLGRGVAWLDGGTPTDLFESSQFVKVVEERTGTKICAPEEVAYRKGFISREALSELARGVPNREYRAYLEHLLESERGPNR